MEDLKSSLIKKSKPLKFAGSFINGSVYAGAGGCQRGGGADGGKGGEAGRRRWGCGWVLMEGRVAEGAGVDEGAGGR
jgi:hypothetical protein